MSSRQDLRVDLVVAKHGLVLTKTEAQSSQVPISMVGSTEPASAKIAGAETSRARRRSMRGRLRRFLWKPESPPAMP